MYNLIRLLPIDEIYDFSQYIFREDASNMNSISYFLRPVKTVGYLSGVVAYFFMHRSLESKNKDGIEGTPKLSYDYSYKEKPRDMFYRNTAMYIAQLMAPTTRATQFLAHMLWNYNLYIYDPSKSFDVFRSSEITIGSLLYYFTQHRRVFETFTKVQQHEIDARFLQIARLRSEYGRGNPTFYFNFFSVIDSILHAAKFIPITYLSGFYSENPIIGADPRDFGIFSYLAPITYDKEYNKFIKKGSKIQLFRHFGNKNTLLEEITNHKNSSIFDGEDMIKMLNQTTMVNDKDYMLFYLYLDKHFTFGNIHLSIADIFGLFNSMVYETQDKRFLTYNEAEHFLGIQGTKIGSILDYLFGKLKRKIRKSTSNKEELIDIDDMYKDLSIIEDSVTSPLRKLYLDKMFLENDLETYKSKNASEKQKSKIRNNLMELSYKIKRGELNKTFNNFTKYYDRKFSQVFDVLIDGVVEDEENEDFIIGTEVDEYKQISSKMETNSGLDFKLINYSKVKIGEKKGFKLYVHYPESETSLVEENNYFSHKLLLYVTEASNFIQLSLKIKHVFTEAEIKTKMHNHFYTDHMFRFMRELSYKELSMKIDPFLPCQSFFNPFSQNYDYSKYVLSFFTPGRAIHRINFIPPLFGAGKFFGRVEGGYINSLSLLYSTIGASAHVGSISQDTISYNYDSLEHIIGYTFLNAILPTGFYMPYGYIKKMISSLPDISLEREIKFFSNIFRFSIDIKKFCLGRHYKRTSYLKSKMLFPSLLTTESSIVYHLVTDFYGDNFFSFLFSTLFDVKNIKNKGRDREVTYLSSILDEPTIPGDYTNTVSHTKNFNYTAFHTYEKLQQTTSYELRTLSLKIPIGERVEGRQNKSDTGHNYFILETVYNLTPILMAYHGKYTSRFTNIDIVFTCNCKKNNKAQYCVKCSHYLFNLNQLIYKTYEGLLASVTFIKNARKNIGNFAYAPTLGSLLLGNYFWFPINRFFDEFKKRSYVKGKIKQEGIDLFLITGLLQAISVNFLFLKHCEYKVINKNQEFKEKFKRTFNSRLFIMRKINNYHINGDQLLIGNDDSLEFGFKIRDSLFTFSGDAILQNIFTNVIGIFAKSPIFASSFIFVSSVIFSPKSFFAKAIRAYGKPWISRYTLNKKGGLVEYDVQSRDLNETNANVINFLGLLYNARQEYVKHSVSECGVRYMGLRNIIHPMTNREFWVEIKTTVKETFSVFNRAARVAKKIATKTYGFVRHNIRIK